MHDRAGAGKDIARPGEGIMIENAAERDQPTATGPEYGNDTGFAAAAEAGAEQRTSGGAGTAGPAGETWPGEPGNGPGEPGNGPGEPGNGPGERGNGPGERGNGPGERGNGPGERGNGPGERGNGPGERGNGPGTGERAYEPRTGEPARGASTRALAPTEDETGAVEFDAVGTGAVETEDG
jgi:hypothetical protein